ncbi:tetratricopeptide repeat protein [Anaeromyxobacter terrae]|uniref:tetratricopeptide repeat protein n=1 Tax=Anaeromyxobacter terrae TaxID=2925406 RepID=UPI001F57A267|nr:tetratricopeptide repeat protein [Anaeromyxobacter sp. SG22]
MTTAPAQVPPRAGGDWPRAPGAVVALCALCLVAYATSFDGPFVFDDVRIIADNPLLRDLRNYLPGGAGYRALPNRYLTNLTFALNYRAGGLAVGGYHAVNVAIHLASALLVRALVLVLFRTRRLAASSLAPQREAIAFVAAALFATHPMQTMAVTYIVQRATSLATLLYLASVVSYGAWRIRREEGRSATAADAALFAAHLLAAGLAMRAKEIAFTLPFAVVALELSFFERRRRWLVPLVPVLATALIIPATLLARAPGTAGALAQLGAATRVETTLGRADYLTTEIAVVVTYLSMLLLPVGQSVDHDYPVHRSLAEPEVAVSLLALALLAGLAAFLFWRTSPRRARPLDPGARLAAFGIGWFFLALSVESTLIPILDVFNEYRVYLASAGLFPAVALGITLAARRVAPEHPGRAALAAGTAVAVVLAAATVVRNGAWDSATALWADAAAKAPRKARPHLNLGTALLEAGRPREAIAPLRHAVELDPASAWGHAQLAGALLATGHAREAEPELREALRLNPGDVEASFNLGTMLWQSGRRDEARGSLEQFLRLAPASYAGARRTAERLLSQPRPSQP